jgi:pilus assembly protein CpaB
MKSTRALVMILFSLLAGAAAVWMAARWVGQQATDNTTLIVVAARDLDPGVPLGSSLLQTAAWPTSSVPLGAFTDVKKLEGRVVGVSVFKGEPVLEAKLAPAGSTGGLSSTIQNGKRAISIQVNEIVGVAGYIRPGSLVDVMVNTREGSDKAVSKIMLEKILVLAVAQDDKRDQTKPKVVSAVTLEVNPQQAEQIDLARNIGTLSLVLRNPLDRTDVATIGARKDDLVGKQAAPPASPPAAPVVASGPAPVTPKPVARVRQANTTRAAADGAASVEVIRGVQKANSEF